jgi:hypothetical protein
VKALPLFWLKDILRALNLARSLFSGGEKEKMTKNMQLSLHGAQKRGRLPPSFFGIK